MKGRRGMSYALTCPGPAAARLRAAAGRRASGFPACIRLPVACLALKTFLSPPHHQQMEGGRGCGHWLVKRRPQACAAGGGRGAAGASAAAAGRCSLPACCRLHAPQRVEGCQLDRLVQQEGLAATFRDVCRFSPLWRSHRHPRRGAGGAARHGGQNLLSGCESEPCAAGCVKYSMQQAY